MAQQQDSRKPWMWIPSLYFMEGMPYVVVTIISGIMFARMGVSNAEMTLYTAWLNLPWMLKPLWSPLVDLYRSQRFWILAMQLLMGAGFAGVGLALPTDYFFRYTLILFWLIAFSSATHDIAIDGFYLSNLDEKKQAFFIGIRSTFYRLAMIAGQGLLLITAGYLESATGLGSYDIAIESEPNLGKKLSVYKLNKIDKSDELKFYFSPEKIKISTQNIAGTLADSTLNAIRDHHTKFHFDENSQKTVASDDYVGNLAIFPVRISASPNEPIILNVNWHSGDKSLKLVAGKRLVFTQENWTQTAYLVFQADKQLTKKTNAIFRGTSGNVPLAWSLIFMILVAVMGVSLLYHAFVLPKKNTISTISESTQPTFFEIKEAFFSFFRRESIVISLLFLLFYRFSESQLSKLTAPFMMDSREAGGLAMTTGEVGWIYGTVGVLALTCGGLLGGWAVAKHGLKKWFWVMVLTINLPNAVYLYLSYFLPESLHFIALCVSVEQFGYGFGLTAYMVYMLYLSQGKYKTSHYAISTGIMALGRMLAEMMSGQVQELVGYQHFFIWVLLATIPCFLIAAMLRFDADFGKKSLEDHV